MEEAEQEISDLKEQLATAKAEAAAFKEPKHGQQRILPLQ